MKCGTPSCCSGRGFLTCTDPHKCSGTFDVAPAGSKCLERTALNYRHLLEAEGRGEGYLEPLPNRLQAAAARAARMVEERDVAARGGAHVPFAPLLALVKQVLEAQKKVPFSFPHLVGRSWARCNSHQILMLHRQWGASPGGRSAGSAGAVLRKGSGGPPAPRVPSFIQTCPTQVPLPNPEFVIFQNQSEELI